MQLLLALLTVISSFILGTTKFFPHLAPTSSPTASNVQTAAIPTPTYILPTPPVTHKVVADVDPITDCVSSAPNCNGSSIRARSSQCSLITCCQVGNTWSVYSTLQKCKDAQSNLQSENTIQNNINSAKSNSYNICSNAVKMTFDSCQSICMTNANTSRLNCGSIPLGEQYTACLDGVTETFNACSDKCLSDNNQGIQKCLGVYK